MSLAAHFSGFGEETPVGLEVILKIHGEKYGPRPRRWSAVSGYRVELTMQSCILAALSGYKGEPGAVEVLQLQSNARTIIWIPSIVLEYGLPRMVRIYHNKQKIQVPDPQYVEIDGEDDTTPPPIVSRLFLTFVFTFVNHVADYRMLCLAHTHHCWTPVSLLDMLRALIFVKLKSLTLLKTEIFIVR